MLEKLLCLVLPVALALPGCTLVGGVAGGSIASHRVHQEELRRARNGEPEGDGSILPGVVGGAVAGLIVDAVVVSMLISAAEDYEPPQLFPPCGAYCGTND